MLCGTARRRVWATAVIALLSSGCGPDTPPPKKPDVQPPENGHEIVRPSGPYSPGVVLQLSDELVQSIRELESTAADPERLCESVERATSLKHELGSVLQERFNAVEGTPQERAFETALDGITKGLVAIAAGVRGANVSTWLELRQLRHPASALELLDGSSECLGAHDPVYVEIQSESRSCARLGAAERCLHNIAEGWAPAPECVRRALEEDLADVMVRIGDARCFCDEKQQALSDIALIGPVLEQLVELDGPVAAEELRTGLKGPDVEFGGECML